MTIQYCSDLHLEFSLNRKYLQSNPLKPVGDILLLAGDIIPFAELEQGNDFFDFVSSHFRQTFWVPGNHEYYGSDFKERSGVINEAIRNNVFLVNNCAVACENIYLIFSTLWSMISPSKEGVIRKHMADFHLIKNNGRKLSVADYNLLHDASRCFLEKELQKEQTGHKCVVVSHHIPTFSNYPEKFKDSDINEAFAVELADVIESSPINYWIYGHSHEVVPDFKVGNTVLTSNQLGYVERQEHRKFSVDKVMVL